MTDADEPRYWLTKDPKPGRQPEVDLAGVPAATMATHTVIVAQSGSGKSVFLGRVVEELMLRTRARCLILDPNSDFRRVHEVAESDLWRKATYDPQTRGGRLPTEASRADFEKQWSSIPVRIRGGGPLVGSGPPYEGFQLWWPSLSVDFLGEDMSPLDRGELYHCHAFVQAIADLVELRARIDKEPMDVIETAEGLWRDAVDRSKTGAEMRNRVDAAIRRTFDVDALADVGRYPILRAAVPASYFFRMWGFPSGPPSQGRDDALARAVRARLDTDIERASTALSYVSSDIARFYFGKAREFRAARILAAEPPSYLQPMERLEVVDLPSLFDKSTRLLAINTILAAEWELARAAWADALEKPSSADERVPTFIVLDEAHNLVPAEPATRAEAAMREQFRTLVAEGRKYGLFLILVSQRPDKLDAVVLSECENKALMRLDSEEVLTLSRRRLGLDSVPPAILSRVLHFGIGRVLLAGRWSREGPRVMYTAARRTVEGGRSLQAEHWAAPPDKSGRAASPP